MSFLGLIFRNLAFYRKSYLAVLAGMVISTAVLTGALVVGDSVRYSLDRLTDIRLGKTRFAIQSGNRFFRQQLAAELAVRAKSLIVPVLQLEGIAVNPDKNIQINAVEILGIDERFVKLWNDTAKQPVGDEAFLSRNTAEKLKLKPGDEFLVKTYKKTKASENAPFVSEKEPLVVFRLKVGAIADDQQMGRFSLKNNQSPPFNIFIPLATLAHKLELDGNANVLLITENKNNNPDTQNLDSLLRLSWHPEDAGLEFEKSEANNTFEIRSDRIFIDDQAAKAIQQVIAGAEPIFTYLVNAISTNSKSTPYSFVTAAGAGYLHRKLSANEIIINNWLADDLGVKTGDSIQLKYFKMGILRKLTEDSAQFCVKAILPVTDSLFDRTLMPDFPGMSDAGNCGEWETGAPVDLGKIRDKDEKYWNNFRGTPKAFISIADGQKLWDNAFGHTTAYRFKADSSMLPALKIRLMDLLIPSAFGLTVQDVYNEGKSAAANSTDFGGLFLSLSFFIIAAALLLTALLFSLHAQKRIAESGILATLGFRKKQIISILFAETSLVIITGGIIGAIAGIYYNKLLLLGLNTLWNDAVRTTMLQMHLVPTTLLAGVASAVIIALLTMLFVLLRNFRRPLSSMVKGIVVPSPALNHRLEKLSLLFALLLFLITAGMVIYSFTSNRTGLSEIFLSAGGIILIAGILLVNYILLYATRKTSDSVPGFYTLILRNASLKKRQTLAAITLLALGTFSVIITGANRKTFYGTENKPQSGTGGFLFWTESTVPFLYDLNSEEGRLKYGLTDEPALQDVKFIQILRQDGNDASCLNLNQVSQPAMLGINASYFDRKQSFSFLELAPGCNDQHPWLTLNKALAPDIIPCFADQTVIQWGLHKKVGDTLLYRDEIGNTLKVEIMGGLENSIFQGNVLVSASLLRHYFPSAAGSGVMLIDGDYTKRTDISARLEYLLRDYGMAITPASERLAQFNSVTNTYLSVFMLLGGLGVILGTFGLGVVILRNIRERQSEMAVYLAIGFKRNFVSQLLVVEYSFILSAGIFIGTFAAFIGLLPSLFITSTSLPWTFIAAILSAILLSGFLWIIFPVKNALKKNLVESLRAE